MKIWRLVNLQQQIKLLQDRFLKFKRQNLLALILILVINFSALLFFLYVSYWLGLGLFLAIIPNAYFLIRNYRRLNTPSAQQWAVLIDEECQGGSRLTALNQLQEASLEDSDVAKFIAQQVVDEKISFAKVNQIYFKRSRSLKLNLYSLPVLLIICLILFILFIIFIYFLFRAPFSFS